MDKAVKKVEIRFAGKDDTAGMFDSVKGRFRAMETFVKKTNEQIALVANGRIARTTEIFGLADEKVISAREKYGGKLPLSHFLPSIADIEAAAKQVEKAVTEATLRAKPGIARAGGEAAKGWLAGLSSVLGKKSTTGKILSLVKGGGAIAAASIGANLFAGVGENVRKFSEEIGKGEIKTQNILDKFIEMVPVLGSVWRGAKDFASALSGSAAEAAKLEAIAKRISAVKAERSQAGKGVSGLLDPIFAGAASEWRTGADLDRWRAESQFDADMSAIAKAEEENEKLRDSLRNSGLDRYDKRQRFIIDQTAQQIREAEGRIIEAREAAEARRDAARAAALEKEKEQERELAQQRLDDFNKFRALQEQTAKEAAEFEKKIEEELAEQREKSRQKEIEQTIATMKARMSGLREREEIAESIEREMTKSIDRERVPFAPLQESRFTTGVNDSTREQVQITYAKQQVEFLKRIHESAKELARLIQQSARAEFQPEVN